MAQEVSNNPNTGATGNQSSNYSEIRSPEFVGGSTNPTTGNIDQSSKSLAASPPPPQVPTTQLANVDAPSLPTQAARAIVPAATADLGTKIGAGAGLTDAATGVANDAINLGNKALNPLGASIPTIGSSAVNAAPIGTEAVTSASSAPLSPSGIPGLGDTLGSTLGGAAGEGIGTLAVDLATGQNLKEAAPSAIGSAVGFAIGNIVLPGIGGFVGSALGGLLCHAAGTMILMSDGSRKAIEHIKTGDEVYLGGKVLGHGEVLAKGLRVYRGTLLQGSHAVFDKGCWLRVKDAASAVDPDITVPTLVYPVVTERHLLVCDEYICADLVETEDEDVSPSQRLATLNADKSLNAFLLDCEDILWGEDGDALLRLEPYAKAEHYPLLVAWWKARGDECLPADVLPPTGAVVTRNSAPIAICSVWLTNARTAYLAMPIAVPGLPPKIAYAAIELAIQGAVDLAKVKGCKFVWSSTANRAIDAILTKRIGFTRTSPHHNHFLLTDPTIAHDILVGHDFTEQKG